MRLVQRPVRETLKMERLRGFGRYQKARLKCDGLNRHPTLQFVNALSYLPTRYSRHCQSITFQPPLTSYDQLAVTFSLPRYLYVSVRYNAGPVSSVSHKSIHRQFSQLSTIGIIPYG